MMAEPGALLREPRLIAGELPIGIRRRLVKTHSRSRPDGYRHPLTEAFELSPTGC